MKDLRHLAKQASFGVWYYAIWGEDFVVERLREFDPPDMGMSQDEAWLFGDRYEVHDMEAEPDRRETLWKFLRIAGEGRAWALLECVCGVVVACGGRSMGRRCWSGGRGRGCGCGGTWTLRGFGWGCRSGG